MNKKFLILAVLPLLLAMASPLSAQTATGKAKKFAGKWVFDHLEVESESASEMEKDGYTDAEHTLNETLKGNFIIHFREDMSGFITTEGLGMPGEEPFKWMYDKKAKLLTMIKESEAGMAADEIGVISINKKKWVANFGSGDMILRMTFLKE